MQSKPQLEAIANYLTDFVASLPGSTRNAVINHIQHCLQTVSQEFSVLEELIKQYQEPGEPVPPDEQAE